MAKRRTNNKKKKSKNWIFKMKVYSILFLLFVTVSFYLLALYNNVNIRSKYSYIYIAEYSTPQTVIQLLKENNFLCNNVSFWLMDKIYPINFPRKGLYKIKKGSGNFELIYQLNNQKLYPYRTYSIPVQKIREPLVTDVCSSAGIELSEFKKIIQDSIFLKKLGGFDRESIYCIFIPGTYRINRRISAVDLVESIHAEYCNFWNFERTAQAKHIGYSPEEITILSSIVYAETKNVAEMPMIAGLYLNRLKKNMRLEADPTLIYASGAHGTKRVYTKLTYIKSNYNTYRNKGLPPGPIGPTPLVSLEASLHPATHNFFYFCAHESLSGCHTFSESYEAHKLNAIRYRKILDKNKIH